MLAKSDYQSVSLWCDYISFIKEHDPAVCERLVSGIEKVRDLFERALTATGLPVVDGAKIWEAYREYEQAILQTIDDAKTQAKEQQIQHIRSVFHRQLSVPLADSQSTLQTYKYLDLFLTRIDGLRRRYLVTPEGENIQELVWIRETCQRAVEYLSPHLKNTDDLLHLHSYWAKLELNLGKDLNAARSVWESLIKTSGSMLTAWQGYIGMEVGQGNYNQARSLYRRCYSRRFSDTGSEEICSSWLRFEREYGTLEDYDLAAQKVAHRLEELRLFKLQQDSKSSVVSTDQTQSLNKKALHEKRKPDSAFANEKPYAKKKKGADQQLIKGDGNNVNQSSKDLDLNPGGGKEVNIVQPSTKPDRDMKKPTQPYTKTFEDKCTAFVSNLNFKATPEDLQDFFKDVGGVQEIRILKDKFTKASRGLAYVDFCDDEHLAAAVAKNRRLLLGKKISIARSNPKRGKEFSGSNSAAKGGEAGPVDGTGTRDHGQGDGVQLSKNTFAVPRNVKPLGFQMTSKRPVNEEEGEVEKPKSNDEFRKMFLKE